MKNASFIESSDKANIAKRLKDMTAQGGSIFANNGAYAFPKDEALPTTLAAFQFIVDRFATNPEDVLLVAVNTDSSMKPFYDKKNMPENERENILFRVSKIMGSLAEQFADRQILIVAYDEETPKELFEYLKKAGLPLSMLYKFGYGTDPDAPPIIGGEYFDRVLAFPALKDQKPFAYDHTPKKPQPFIPTVLRLSEEIGPHGAPYLTPEGKILFPVVPELRKYIASYQPRP